MRSGFLPSMLVAAFLASSALANAHAGQHDASHAKQPLAVSAVFDANDRLWRATVEDGHVWVSYSDDQGKTFSEPVKVNNEPENIAADGENRPKILTGQNGKVYVSYTQTLDKPYSGNVRFSRSVDGGQHFSAPVTVNDNPEVISHRFDSLAVNSHGQIYLAWLDKRDASAAAKKGQDYTGAAVYYAVSNDGGASFANNIKVSEHSCECCRIAMAVGPDDIPVVFWRQVFDKNVRDHAMQRLERAATPLRVTYDNWRVDACPHHGPSLAISGNSTEHFVWFDNAPERQGLFYARSEDGGRDISPPLSFGNNAAQASHPYVLSMGERVFVVWKEFDGENAVVLAMISENGGLTWSAPRKMAATSGASDHPLLIADHSSAYLSWNTAKEGYRLVALNGTGAIQ